MAGILPRLIRGLIYTAATAVIVLALLVGLVRLLLPQVPEYQEEVRRVAEQATGFDVDFVRLSASWPLRGPELSLYDVRLLDPQTGAELVAAEQIAVGLSVFRLFGEGALVPSRLAVSGIKLDIERQANNDWRLQGRPLADWLGDGETSGAVPEIDLLLEDVQLRYNDAAIANSRVDAQLSSLALTLNDDQVSLDGRVELDGAVPGRVALSALVDGELLSADRRYDDVEWTVSLDTESLDLRALLDLALRSETPLVGAFGDLELNARMRGFQPTDAVAEFDFEDVVLRTGDAGEASYPRLAGAVEWGTTRQGWVLAARELRVQRPDSMWPRSDLRLAVSRGDDGSQSLLVSVSFLRLQDLYPLVEAVATPEARDGVLPAELRGDVRAVDFALTTRPEQAVRYSLSVEADRLGIVDAPRGITADGLSGNVVADQDGGRLELASADARFALPDVFPDPLLAEELSGFLVWRVTEDAVRVLSDSFRVSAPDITATSRFEVSVPRDGRSARLDLAATARAEGTRALVFIPTGKMPPPVGRWLKRAIVGGRIPEARIRFDGALREWPYDHGEGLFRVDIDIEDVVLDYAPGWPAARELDGTVVFDGISFFSERNSGRLAGLPVRNAQVRIEDLRKGLLEIRSDQRVPVAGTLELLRALPVTAGLGPVMQRLKGEGQLAADLDLQVPVLRPAEYRLRIDAEIENSTLGLSGLEYGFSSVNGGLRVRNTRLDADRIDAELLGEPVQVKLRSVAADSAAFGHYALVEGAIPATRWAEALKLPFSERLEGTPQVAAMALVPAPGSGRNFHVLLRSGLEAVVSSLPEPLRKTAEETRALQVDVGFPAAGSVRVRGDLDRELRWDLLLDTSSDSWRVARGALQLGGSPADLPLATGVEITGTIPRLVVDDWLDLGGDSIPQPGEAAPFRELAIAVAELTAFGQVFRNIDIFADQRDNGWRIELDGERASGVIGLPGEPTQEQPLRVDLQRLWLIEPAEGEVDELPDPRDVPSMEIAIADFRIADLRFGSLDTEINPVGDGVVASTIGIVSGSFSISGDADWRVLGDDRSLQRSSLRLNLESSDVAGMLDSFGYSPVLDAPAATASADLSWAGPPSADFLSIASGGFRFRMERGTLKQLDPGGGRLLGVLSVSALPRRLSLDFSDLVDEGLGFDVLQGDFDLESGNAYTCNLGLEGSVADLGIVGRTGLRDRDYDQLAVVRPHVGGALAAIGGTVVGGPVGGAAAVLIAQIFRKPLSQLGESYYEISGPWEDASIQRVQRTQVDTARFSDCERYLAQVLPEQPELDAEPGSELPEEIVP
jgi:uncharacterized protein (TIGR02099 family)